MLPRLTLYATTYYTIPPLHSLCNCKIHLHTTIKVKNPKCFDNKNKETRHCSKCFCDKAVWRSKISRGNCWQSCRKSKIFGWAKRFWRNDYMGNVDKVYRKFIELWCGYLRKPQNDQDRNSCTAFRKKSSYKILQKFFEQFLSFL